MMPAKSVKFIELRFKCTKFLLCLIIWDILLQNCSSSFTCIFVLTILPRLLGAMTVVVCSLALR